MALIQAALLLLVNIGVLLYVIYKSRIKTMQVTGVLQSLVIGFLLGAISAFLGIGGGSTVNMPALLLMCVGGALIGSKLSKIFSEHNVETLFTVVLIALIALGGYNVYSFA